MSKSLSLTTVPARLGDPKKSARRGLDMRQLIQSTHAYRLLKAERAENRLNHTYLLVFDDARNLRPALKEFAKLFFLTPEEAAAEADGAHRSFSSHARTERSTLSSTKRALRTV